MPLTRQLITRADGVKQHYKTGNLVPPAKPHTPSAHAVATAPSGALFGSPSTSPIKRDEFGFDENGLNSKGFSKKEPAGWVTNGDDFKVTLAEAEKGTRARQLDVYELKKFSSEVNAWAKEQKLSRRALKGSTASLTPYAMELKGTKFPSAAQASSAELVHDGKGWKVISVARERIPYWRSYSTLWELKHPTGLTTSVQ